MHSPARSLTLILGLVATSCAGVRSHPCLDAGEPPRDSPFQGTRQCTQRKDPSGRYVNDGLYREWHPNGKLALEGRYHQGRRDGLWTLWDDQGRKISAKEYKDGVEINLPASTAGPK